jgi:hypothetical protein
LNEINPGDGYSGEDEDFVEDDNIDVDMDQIYGPKTRQFNL